jgi:beta-mannosidase
MAPSVTVPAPPEAVTGRRTAPRGRGVTVAGHEERWLTDGWELAGTPAGVVADPQALRDLPGLCWGPARVPGTVAAALGPAACADRDLDAEDWWFRTSFVVEPVAEGDELVVCLDGVATVADVWLDGELSGSVDSMWAAIELDVGHAGGGVHELVLCCRALAPLLAVPRRPRARWRTRLVADGALRWARTMLLGRMPGVAPGPPAVGPWRPVRLVRRRRWAAEDVRLLPVLEDGVGRLHVNLGLRRLGSQPPLDGVLAVVEGPSGRFEAPLSVVEGPAWVHATGTVELPGVAPWWPHTHGRPDLHDVRLRLLGPGDPPAVDAGRVGFRTLAAGPADGHDVERDGPDLHVNGCRVFARGAVWTPLGGASLAPSREELRATILAARDGGLNLLRIVGTGAYENDAFHDLCDELGMLVWQDLMFANLDYPFADEAFAAQVAQELSQVLGRLAGRPSFAVLCGNSEVEQQVAMLGLDPALGRGPFFGEAVPAMLRASGADAVHVPSAPCGGSLPFRPGSGVANWFAVGGYRRPLGETRAAGVRFASECLALSNVPGDDMVAAAGPDGGVPRDAGADWDFADVRDHYLRERYGLDPAALRAEDEERYLELSRSVSGQVMAAVFGEWRRAASPCRGGIVLWLRDLEPGAGWGLLDSAGTPKVAWHHLRRVLAPTALWTTDEGTGGLAIHVAHDGRRSLPASLSVSLFRDGRDLVAEGTMPVTCDPCSVLEVDAEAVLGHFADITYAHRFGPPGHDLVVVRLVDARDGEVLAQTTHEPLGPTARTLPVAELGLRARVLEPDASSLDDRPDERERVGVRVRVHCRSGRVAHDVRLRVPGFVADDEAFTLAPGETRVVTLRPARPGLPFPGGTVTAREADGSVPILGAA